MTISVGELTPSYLTVDPTTGKIGANFTGKVSAQEIDFQAGSTNQSQIRWLRQSDGAVVAQIFGDNSSNVDAILNMLATMQGPADTQAEVDITAISNPNVGSAELQVSLNNITPGSAHGFVSARVNAQDGGGTLHAPIIIDSLGASSFLQLTSVKDAHLNYGTQAMPFAAGSNTSNGVTFAHGLGAVPAAVACLAVASPAFGEIPLFNLFSWDATNIGVNAETKNAFAAATNVDFNWIAIG